MPGLSLRNDLLYSHGWLLDKDPNPVASASAIWSLESESGEAIEHVAASSSAALFTRRRFVSIMQLAFVVIIR